MRNAHALVALLPFALTLAACGPSAIPCAAGECPQVGDLYQIESTQVSGSCSFTPMTLGSSLNVSQSGDGMRAAVAVFDPVQGVPLELIGDVYTAPENTRGVTGEVSATTQVARPATQISAELVNMDVTFTMSVSVTTVGEKKQRSMSGALISTVTPSDPEEEVCQITISFSGPGSSI